jgi:hypothetical protein
MRLPRCESRVIVASCFRRWLGRYVRGASFHSARRRITSLVASRAVRQARPRKLRKLHTQAQTALARLSLSGQPTIGSIGRDENEHADALSRAAVDAAAALHAAAALAAARAGEVQRALALLEGAARARVALGAAVYDETLAVCHERAAWGCLLGVHAAAIRADRWRASGGEQRAYPLAADALLALGASSKGQDAASRQLTHLRRRHEEGERSRTAARRRAAECGACAADEPEAAQAAQMAATARGASASAWRAHVVSEAGGVAALSGDDILAVPRLLGTADCLAGVGLGCGGGGGDVMLPSFEAAVLRAHGQGTAVWTAA